MGRKNKKSIHNIRDVFTGTDLLEGATLTQSSESDVFKVEGFTIIKVGESNNGNYYSAECLREAGRVGVFNGKQIRTDHPDVTRPESVKDIVGMIESSWYDNAAGRLKGNCFFSSVEKDLVTKVNEGLIGDLSINARGVAKIEKTGDGLRRNIKEITEGFSVDLVCQAAAGGTLHEEFNRNKQLGERMKKRMDDLEKLTIDDLKESRPDLLEKILEGTVKQEGKDKTKETDEVKPMTADEVSTLVTESMTKILDKRDEVADKKETATILTEGSSKAVTEVLAESNVSDFTKGFVAKSLVPFATENFKDLAAIDSKKLSEERDRLLKEFETILEEHQKFEPKEGNDGIGKPTKKVGTKLIDLLEV